MPCDTLVQIEIKDKNMAEKALGTMGEKGNFVRNSNGTWTFTPDRQRQFDRDKFMIEYGIEVATKSAKAEGYYVTRTQENGEDTLVLRQY
jgi:hypothetical protein